MNPLFGVNGLESVANGFSTSTYELVVDFQWNYWRWKIILFQIESFIISFVGESQFEANCSDDEDNASDANGEMIDRRPYLNTGAGYTPATGTGVPNNAPAPDPRNQNSLSQSTIHDPGRPPPRAGPAIAGGGRTSSPSSGISSGRTDDTRTTNGSYEPRQPERAPAIQIASAPRVALGDMRSKVCKSSLESWLEGFIT